MLISTSERYRTLFWDKYPTPVFVELNFKHLLGRAPANYQEVAQHMKLLAESGLEAEIDSYLDSDEYSKSFGDFSVPFFRGYVSQPGINNVGFNHAFSLAGLACSSDKSLYDNANSKLETKLIQNKSSRSDQFPIPIQSPLPLLLNLVFLKNIETWHLIFWRACETILISQLHVIIKIFNED